MTLIFSRLIQDFITFGTAGLVFDNAQQSGNATAILVAQQNLNSAVDQFRRSVALDASYLTYIGNLVCWSQSILSHVCARSRHVRLYLCLHVCVGIRGRST